MAIGETLTDFFYTSGGFAENATIGAATVTVIFDNAAADPFGIVAGTHPEALAISTEVASVAVGDTITLRSITYTVAEIQPDGTGLTRLMLKT